MNILSVDWDYFIKASEEQRLLLFPDGGEFPYIVQTEIWKSLYSCAEDRLLKIKVDNIKFRTMNTFLSYATFKKVCVARSHAHIVPFIERNLDGNPLNIVHFDHHHDMFYSGSSKLNCGNWLRKFTLDCREEEKANRVMWVRRVDSQVNSNEFPEGVPVKSTTLFSRELFNKENHFDCLFICRSDAWSPPHLDEYFTKLIVDLEWGHSMEFAEYVDDNRYTDEFKAQYRQERKVRERFEQPSLRTNSKLW